MRIVFHIQNYHYERRVQHYTSNGKRRTRTKRVRVNTHSAQKDMIYSQWADSAPPAESLKYLETIPLTRLKNNKIATFSPQARLSYQYQLSTFEKFNIRDVHHDLWISYELAGFEANQLVYNDLKMSSAPWFISPNCFYFLTAFMISWIQRIAFIRNTTKVEFTVSKYIIA